MPWSESTPTKTRVITIILVLGLFAGGVAAFIDTGGPEAVEPGKTSVRWFASTRDSASRSRPTGSS